MTEAQKPAARRRGEQTRARILTAAEKCFAQFGYEGTGVAAICRRAGISKGALYHHFASKQAIFVELFEDYMNGLITEMGKIRDGAASVPEALLSMVQMTGHIFQAAADRLPLFFEFLTKAAREPEIWRATTAPYRQFREFFADMIRRGIREGFLRSVDPESTAQVIVSFGAGLVMQGVFDPAGADWAGAGIKGIKLILEGIVKEGKS